jgi:NADP-dependent 3-hydroxy acid dehydrogenase YdfG
MPALCNQVVLITGCSSGIGRALATEFARVGHRVVATARRLESIRDLAAENIRPVRLDVTEGASIDGAVAEGVDWAGDIDMVVNNAGYALIGPTSEVKVADLRIQLETNVVGLVAVAQAVIPRMVERGNGRIVNIGSVSGVTTTPFSGAYCGSKAAVHMLSDALRMELSPFGIRVITVQPGSVISDFGNNAHAGLGRYRSDSLFSGVSEFIEARAQLSQQNGTPADEFARDLVSAVTRKRVPAVVRLGSGCRKLPAIGRLPVRIRDWYLGRRFGLEGLQ